MGDWILRSGNKPLKKSDKSSAAERPRDGRDAGAVLRSVYQQTVEETIPAEMLDLLNKLA
ncbi:MAG: hypothetical protein K2P68_06410 [Sphingomonas sp.]|nr:hypothetical protein [Sphingomonas sp.]